MFTIFMLSIGGLIILAVMVFGVTKQLRMSESEDKAFMVMEKLSLTKIKRELAVELIGHWYLCCLLHRRGLLWNKPKLIFKVKNLCSEFKTVNR